MELHLPGFPQFLTVSVYVRTYIPIHNALAEAVCCYFPRTTMFAMMLVVRP